MLRIKIARACIAQDRTIIDINKMTAVQRKSLDALVGQRSIVAFPDERAGVEERAGMGFEKSLRGYDFNDSVAIAVHAVQLHAILKTILYGIVLAERRIL